MQECAAGTLCLLSALRENRAAIASAGAILRMLALLESSTSLTLASVAAAGTLVRHGVTGGRYTVLIARAFGIDPGQLGFEVDVVSLVARVLDKQRNSLR